MSKGEVCSFPLIPPTLINFSTVAKQVGSLSCTLHSGSVIQGRGLDAKLHIMRRNQTQPKQLNGTSGWDRA